MRERAGGGVKGWFWSRRSGIERALILGTISVAVALAAAASTRIRAQEPKAASKPQAPAASATERVKVAPDSLDESASREVTRAVQQLRGAVAKRNRVDQASVTAEVSKTPLPHRPGRSVTPPKMTPAELDRLVERYLAKNDPRIDPAPLTSDVEFVRRVYFDLAGVPPTPAQVVRFLGDKTRDKRSRLIESLLQSQQFAQNWARYWRDVIQFRATNQNRGQVRYDLLEEWLAEQFRQNRPWDEIATELITATGRVDENGAVSFALAHDAKPVELAGEVSRIFMGVQIQCAQCHDHKTDSWKQIQFHEFAAFFSGERARVVSRGMAGKLPVFEVQSKGRPRYTMPDKDNAARQIPVAPKFFLASSKNEPKLPLNLESPVRHALAASYVTGQDNPWFARAFVNRIWYVLMGESFYGAIDDIGPERTPKAPQVIETLADQWQKGGYDVRWLLRTITETRAYQRRVRSTANAAGKTVFASNCPSRLRSDQIVEGLVQALGLPDDLKFVPASARKGSPGAAIKGKGKRQQTAAIKLASGKKAAEAAGLASAPVASKGLAKAVRRNGPRVLFNALFGVDPSVPNEEVLGTIPQALFLMNSPLIQNRTQARPGTVLGEILATSPSPRAALDALYLRVLSRYPNAQEVKTCSSYISQVGNLPESFEDIYWSIINSTEFISRR
jgi:Protein of unknown function (DUF1549)/Protein of unknown function (DUF1553)